MKTIKSIEYALMHLDAIKRDVRYYDESLRDSGMRYGDIAIVVELKGDGYFTHKVMCADWSLNEIALDAYKVVIAKLTRDHDDNEVLESDMQSLKEILEAHLGREYIIERKLSAMEN